MEVIRINNNLYTLIQDKVKIIKSYNSKANAANKKNTPKQKWIRLPFPSEKEIDNNDNENEPPTQTQITPPKDENKSTGDGDNAVKEEPPQP